jgi:Mg2+-importing ATPase
MKRLLPWLFGALVLAGAIAAAIHFSEARQFVQLAKRAEPAWLLVALALQLATYFAEGEVWQLIARRTGAEVPRVATVELALAKLFVDQAVPSAGISGTLVIARSLERRGVERPAVAAGMVVDSASYHLTYVACLAAALVVTIVHHQANRLVVFAATGFTLFALTVARFVLALPGQRAEKLKRKLARFRRLERVLAPFADADSTLAREPRVLIVACLFQLAIFLLDAASVWVLILASGSYASPGGVYASFMISTLFRTIGILPGGLGTYEASSLLTLRIIGVELPVALSATLLFRGLSFWLPMLPGLWFARRAMARSAGDHSSGQDLRQARA